MKKIARVLPVALVASLMLTGCEDPCAKLEKGTPDQIANVEQGIELEREVDNTECVLTEDGTWEKDA